MRKEQQPLTVLLNATTVQGLRDMAAAKGLFVKNGPAAGHGQGSISQLLKAIVAEWHRSKSNG